MASSGARARYSWLLGTTLVWTGLVTTPMATAAEWSVVPTLKASVLSDDNYFLTTTQQTSTSGLLAWAGLSLNRNSETGSSSLGVRAQSRQYDEPAIQDAVDGFLDLNLNTRTERNMLGLTANASKETTTVSELDITGPVQTDRKVRKYSVQPSWTFFMTQRDSLQVSYAKSEADYEALPTEFADYEYASANLTYQRQFTESDSVNLTLGYSELDVPDIGYFLAGVTSNTTTKNASLGYNHAFSETLSGNVQIGTRDTEQKVTYVPLAGQPEVITKGKGNLYNLSLTNKLEAFSWHFSASRELTPGSDGELNQTDRSDIRLNWRTSARQSFSLSGGYIDTQTALTSSTIARRYYWVQPGIAYMLGREVQLAANYQLRRQKYENAVLEAESNRVMLTLSYTGKI